jgi:glutathione synthase/RimK-type ligase-like ATP-grasp enzyme
LPETLISNDYQAVKKFIQQYQDVILKPASGGALTLTPEQINDERLKKVREVPAIFQQRIRGDDIRVIVVNGRVISAAKINVPDDTLDFRGNEQYQQGYISYSEIVLPDKISHLCRQLTQNLGLRIGGIDLKHTKDNQFYFLECNSSPIYLDVEIKLGHPISQTICNALLS